MLASLPWRLGKPPLTAVRRLTWRPVGASQAPAPSPHDKPDFPGSANKVSHTAAKALRSASLSPSRLFSWLEKEAHSPRPPVHQQASPGQSISACVLVSSRAWWGVLGPAPSTWRPPLLPTPRRPQGRRRGPAEGAAHDPERKGPSLGPNAGGVSLDRRRLGTTARTGDKVTYQSRFGARADTPRPTGNAELFKRPYRLLYLSRRKASCRETKDVPHLEIPGRRPPPSAEGGTGGVRSGRGESGDARTAACAEVGAAGSWSRDAFTDDLCARGKMVGRVRLNTYKESAPVKCVCTACVRPCRSSIFKAHQ